MDMNWYSQAVCLKDKVYFSSRVAARLFIYTPATDTWDIIDTPVYDFALTTYHSQLVLVGGYNHDDNRPSAKLWTLSEEGQWQDSLPPMETTCINLSAVSYGDHLLVIDGDRNEVNVYNGRYWAKAEHLPGTLFTTNSVALSEELYVIRLFHFNEVYSASLDSLIASCRPSETSQPSSVWKKLPDIPVNEFYPTVFGRRLTVIGKSAIHVYSPSIQSWIRVRDSPYAPSLFTCGCAIGLPSNELIVVCNGKVYKAIIKSKCSEV